MEMSALVQMAGLYTLGKYVNWNFKNIPQYVLYAMEICSYREFFKWRCTGSVQVIFGLCAWVQMAGLYTLGK